MAYSPPWLADLQPASWRGLTFGVNSMQKRGGRRVAVHEYPYRDLPWVEDLGRGPQEVTFQGFLLGDDVASQYGAFLAECDKPGPGDLVHPRWGLVTANLIGCAFRENKEAGNMVELELTFLVTQRETDSTRYPLQTVSTASALAEAALNADGSATGGFLKQAGDAIRNGRAAVTQLAGTAQGYVNEARGLVNDATRAVNAVKPIANMLGVSDRHFGRFYGQVAKVSGGFTTVNRGLSAVRRADSAATSLISGATRARNTVGTLGDNVMALVKKIT